MSARESAVATALAGHERSGVSSVSEGCGDDERTVGYHAWCYCASAADDLEGAAQWRGTFNVPAETARAELRAHTTAAVLAALDTTPQPAPGVHDCDGWDSCPNPAHQSTPPAQAEAVAVVERVRALEARWRATPKPAHGWNSGLSATEAGERLGAWRVMQRRAAELRAALDPLATARAIADTAAAEAGSANTAARMRRTDGD